MNQRLRPNQRIRERRTFQLLFKKGKSARGTFLKLWVIAATESAGENPKALPRLAVVVSRKVDKRAVKRNLWKRRIREAFRRQQSQARNGIAVMIHALPQDAVPSYQVIYNEVEKLLTITESLK